MKNLGIEKGAKNKQSEQNKLISKVNKKRQEMDPNKSCDISVLTISSRVSERNSQQGVT